MRNAQRTPANNAPARQFICKNGASGLVCTAVQQAVQSRHSDDVDSQNIVKSNNTSTPTIAEGPIGHKKLYFTDEDDKVVIMHGMNIMQKVAPYYFPSFYQPNPSGPGTIGESWGQFWKDNGFNIARVGISWAGVEPSAGNYDDSYILKIRDIVRMFAKYGVFCSLDFHQDGWCGEVPGMGDVPGSTSGSFGGNTYPVWAANYYLAGVSQPNTSFFPFNVYESAALRTVWDNFWHNVPAFADDSQTIQDTVGVQDRYINMAKYVATFFKDECNLLAYESGNEQNMDIQTWELLGSPGFLDVVFGEYPLSILLQNTLTGPYPPFSRPIPPSPPYISDFWTGLFNDFHERFNTAIHAVDPRHMLSNNLSFTETLIAGGAIPNRPKPGNENVILSKSSYGLLDTSLTTPDESQRSYGIGIAIAENNNMAFLATEFGGPLDLVDQVPGIVSYFASKLVSWCYWEFAQGFGNIQEDAAILINTDLPAIPSNIRYNLSDQFTEPYPRVIAGTPLSYSYDPNTQVFNFEYTTDRVVGCSKFKKCALTEIAVPSRCYPNGYQVQITNGENVSTTNDRLLIKAIDCPNSITIIITPRITNAPTTANKPKFKSRNAQPETESIDSYIARTIAAYQARIGKF
jgi:endoglycosylceramidase